MNTFTLRRQTVKTHRVGAATLCRWMELENDDIKIIIDGCRTKNSLIIHVVANGIAYQLTDSLLEMMLGQVAEQFSNDFISFSAKKL